MKKKITKILLLIICMIIIAPTGVYAETFKPANTDVNIDIDESRWYVFSRDNIEGNEELTYLDIEHEYMAQYMEDENIYLYNIIFFGDREHYIELLVKKTANGTVNNLNNFERKEVLEIAKTMGEERGLSEYSMYGTDNKYILFDYKEDELYCKDYVTIINGDNYTFTARNPFPFVEADLEIVETAINSATYDIDPNKVAEEREEKGLSKFSLGVLVAVFIGGAVLVVAIICFVRWKTRARFKNEMNKLYETISINSKSAVFSGGKKEFYFVGKMLEKLFPKYSLKELFVKYVNLHKTYINYEKDVYKSFKYAEKAYNELETEEIYTLLSLVKLCVDGVKRYDDDSVERIEPFRRNAKAKVKAVETINLKKDIFSIKTDIKLGEKDNPILVGGVSGVMEYMDSIVTEQGKEIDYYHKSTMYIRDSKLGIEYDLKNYAILDKEEKKELCTVWFNTYGTENCDVCIEGFKFKES